MPHQLNSQQRADDLVLLRIRCSRAEADTIREAAKQERRGISQFVLSVLLNHIEKEPQLSTSLRPLARVGRKKSIKTDVAKNQQPGRGNVGRR